VAGRPGQRTTRNVPTFAPKKNNLPLILGAAGGGLLLLIIIGVAASGTSSSSGTSNTRAPEVRPVDVAGLEAGAERKCGEALGIIQRAQQMMDGRELTKAQQASLKNDLDRGIALMNEGMGMFDEAHAKSGHMYDTVKYNQAAKAARMKVGELSSGR
jgi:hypothetical protein